MIFELAHQSALLPLIALGWVLYKQKLPKRDYAILSAAFFMSWIGDSLSTDIEQGVGFGHLWAPAQITLAYAAIIEKWNLRRISIVSIVCTFALLFTQLNPETGVYLWLTGSIGLLILGQRSLVRIPIFIYFGLGTVTYLLMINEINGPHVMTLWVLYQVCRLTALISLCILILRTQGANRGKLLD